MKTQSTREHQPPARPDTGRTRPALVAAFPRSLASPLPHGAVGRAWLDGLGLSDTEVSGAHFELRRDAVGVARIRDLGSRNGTFLDGARLKAGSLVPLREGAILRVGRTLFVHRGALIGQLRPDPPLGGMVGPYGLRAFAATVEAWRRERPRNVLVLGETGTGKELASAFVAASLERHPCVPVNMTAIPSGVFEGQLFGHTAGAFSGAGKASRGIFASADGGAVILDEIGDLPLELQPKLLRLLENREVFPVGADRPSTVDLLVVAATHRDLAEMVELGQFRRDLFARLSIATTRLPPLRERPEDLFEIARAIASWRGHSLEPEQCEVEAVEQMLLDAWPANVRDVVALLAKARLADPSGRLSLWAIESELPSSSRRASKPEGTSPPEAPASAPRSPALDLERVRRVLESCASNESEAARVLGVSRGALRRFLEKARGHS